MNARSRHSPRSTGRGPQTRGSAFGVPVPPASSWARCPCHSGSQLRYVAIRVPCLVLLAAALSLGAQNGPAPAAPLPSGSPFPGLPEDTAESGTSPVESTWGRKLVHADAILGEFEKGSQRVRVIVNLLEPTTSLEEPAPAPLVRTEAIRRYRQRVSRRHAEVEVIQTPVLAALQEKEFGLRHRYDNWASFAGEVTLEGLAKLAANPLVESIEFDYPMKRLTKQGIPLMHASEVRSTYNGQGVAIAIVDDGIDCRHPKLGGGGFPNSKVIGGYDVADHDTDPGPDLNLAECTHGTNCAGIAAGDVAAEGDYIGGVACGAKLAAISTTVT
jgi:subtilisin family serine protease